MRFPHSHYSKGANIRIVTREGVIITGKFIERRSRWVRLDTGKIPTECIKTMNRLAPSASPAQKIPRQAEHGTGGTLGTGYASSARRGPSRADRKREVERSNDAGTRRRGASPRSNKAAGARRSLNGEANLLGE